MLEIAQRRGVKVIAKGKTMISEEIELNHALEAAGPHARRDRPRRVDRPARRRAALAHPRAGDPPLARPDRRRARSRTAAAPMSDDPEGLVTYSREALRSVFLEAEMGITGGNFLVAETRHGGRARERGQRPPGLVAAARARRARRPRARARDDRRCRVHGRAAHARGGRPRAAELRLLAQRARRPTATTAPRSSS